MCCDCTFGANRVEFQSITPRIPFSPKHEKRRNRNRGPAFTCPSGCPVRYAPAPSTPRIGCPLTLFPPDIAAFRYLHLCGHGACPPARPLVSPQCLPLSPHSPPV